MASLEGKVAVVTGSGQGLGRGYAMKLAEMGAKVVVAELNAEKAERVAGEIRTLGKEAIAHVLDVSDEERAQQMASAVMAKWGRIDILVNNAAYFSTIIRKPFEQISGDEWDLAMRVNLKGTFNCCKAVVPYMKAQQSGAIVNVTSSTVLFGRPLYLHYVTSKAGVIGLTRALSRELGEFGIRVNTLCPGLTLTEVPRTTITEETVTRSIASQSIKRSGAVDDLAKALAFLVSDDAGFITGQLLNVDGGESLY